MITAIKNTDNIAFKADGNKVVQSQTNKNIVQSKAVTQNNTQSNIKKTVYDKNPIKRSGERATALLATLSLGAVAGLRLLLMILDDGEGEGAKFLVEFSEKIAKKILKKNGKPGEKLTKMNKIFAPVAVVAAFVAAFAFVYTLYNLPKTLYKADVKTYKKKKEMDVYIKGNAVEQELYNQMNEKAKTATQQDKAKLNAQYAKLKAAKNVVPAFVKLQK